MHGNDNPGNAELRAAIESAFAQVGSLNAEALAKRCGAAVETVLDGLETGVLRVAEPANDGAWTVNDWIKKAVLLYFRMRPMARMPADASGLFGGFDKVPLRFAGDTADAGYR